MTKLDAKTLKAVTGGCAPCAPPAPPACTPCAPAPSDCGSKSKKC